MSLMGPAVIEAIDEDAVDENDLAGRFAGEKVEARDGDDVAGLEGFHGGPAYEPRARVSRARTS